MLGIDEVWALGGPQAIGWLAYVRKVDKIVGPGNSYVNEAKLEVQRDVAIDLPGGPSEVVVVASGEVDQRIVELELAAQAEHGQDAVCRVVETLEEAEAIAPEHLVLLGECRGARRPACATPARSSSAPSSPVAAGDYATGGNHVLPTGGWARSVGGLGLETFLKPVTTQRLTPEGLALPPADRRGARRRRGDARARGGGAAMKQLSPEFRAYTWAPPNDEVARLAGIDPLAGRPLRPEHAAAAAPVDAPGHDRGRARRRSAATRPAATTSFAARSPPTTASIPTRSCSAPAPTT